MTDTSNKILVKRIQLTSQFDEFKQVKPPSPMHGLLNVISTVILLAFVYIRSLDIVAVGGILSIVKPSESEVTMWPNNHIRENDIFFSIFSFTQERKSGPPISHV